MNLQHDANNFFYIKAINEQIMASNKKCNDLKQKINVDTCNQINFNDNSLNCIQNEFCKNKELSEWITNNKDEYYGSKQKYLDIESKYNNELLNITNLGIGIIILTGFIIKNTYLNIYSYKK